MLVEGQVVGPIRMVGRLGAGGMGEVWEGIDERLGRPVAVKAIRRSADEDPLARARFAREARILSRLEHPNVCRLYEYLHTDELDLLVLELLRGRPLGRAIAEGLGAGEKLAVAIGIGQALLAAHAVSVVHRDLKPDNVMLGEDGTVKVLDFGIARRTGEDAEPGDAGRLAGSDAGPAGGADGLTIGNRVIGTPRYMSPEQARGEPATAASDMFCFGLLLFELYSGESAYGEGSLVEILTRAQWGDVPPVAGIDRGVAALVRDLTRLEPARRPTAQQALERLRAVERRPLRRLKLAAAIVVAASLVAGTALSLAGLARARREAAAAQATADFLVRLFQSSDPQQAPSPDIRAREVLARGVARLRDELRGQPAIRARLLAVLGGIHANLGLHREAAGLLQEALALQETLVGVDDPALLPALGSYGNALSGLGELARAEETLRRAVDLAEKAALPAEQATALNRLAALLVAQRRLDEAEPLARRAVELREATAGPDDPSTAEAAVNLALIEIDRGHPEAAEPRLAAALATLERAHGPDHPSVAAVVNNLATARNALARFAEAEALYRRALASAGRRLDPEHPELAVMRNDLAVALVAQERYAEAEAEYRLARAVAGKALGAGHPMTAIVTANLGEALELQGRAEEAEPLLREALAALRAAFGAEHPAVAEVLRVLGRTSALQGRSAEAERLLLDAVRIREAAGEATHPDFGRLLTQLGAFYLDGGRAAEATAVLARAQTVLGAAALPSAHPARRELAATLARLPAGGEGGAGEVTPWLVALLAGLALGAVAVVLLQRRERRQLAALAALAARLEELEARWVESLRPPDTAASAPIADVAAAEVEEAGTGSDPGTVPPTSDVLAGLTSHVQQLLHAGASGVEILADRAILETYRQLAGPLTPSGLAEALYVSLRTLERGLAVALDCTPGQLIATVRMREARRLLAEGRRVSEVADELGFANPFHFSRRYKRFYGMAPSEARRSSGPLSRRG